MVRPEGSQVLNAKARRWLAALGSAGTLALAAWACSSGGSSTTTAPTSTAATSTTPTVTSVAVTGTTPAVGAAAQFSAKAALSNGTTQDVTASATWQSTSMGVATVTIAGIVSGVSAGSTTIMATYQSVSGSLAITVASGGGPSTPSPSPAPATPTVSSVSVSGSAPALNATSQFTATAALFDGSSQTVTSQASWQSSNTAVATVSSTGAVTGRASGSITISATYQSKTGSASITIQAPSSQVAEPSLPSRAASGNTFTCSLNDITHPASCVNSSFGDATALCNDGARSCSANNSGTCSSHSGVYCWVCPGGLCPN